MKLNLGSGRRHLDGWINVDKYPPADIIHDLESLPWPWKDNSVELVMMCHVLEHLGQTPKLFLEIMQELYRVCANGASVVIMVPDPHHDFYLNDPTHVRPVTAQMLGAFSKKNCEMWIKNRSSNTPLALHLGVDFETVSTNAVPDERFANKTNDEINAAYHIENNVISEMTIQLKVVKPV